MSAQTEKSEREKLIGGIVRLIKETQEGKVLWERKKPPTSLKLDANTVVDLVYETQYKRGRLRIYEENYKVEEPGALERPFNLDRLLGTKYPYWTSGVILELVDERGNTLWTFPRVSGLDDLLRAVQYQDARVRDFLDALTDENSLQSLSEEILKRIQELDRGGVVATASHFRDIADEKTIRQHLSDLIREKKIVGGLGSIIQLTPVGLEFTEKPAS